MRRLKTIRLAMIAALFACVHGPAAATQAPPVDIQLREPGDLAVVGVPYRNALRIALPSGGELGPFVVGQQGWTTNWIDPVPVGVQPPGTVIELEFEVVPLDVRPPIQFSGQWNGLPVGTSVDLSLDGYERATMPRALTALPAGTLPPFTPPPGWVNEVLPNPDGQPVVPAGSHADKDRTITVRGTFAYIREDGAFVAAYGTTAEVYDDDTILSKLLGSAVVDLDGKFEVTFNWNEGFFSENDPDIYVLFVAKNSVAQVKAGVFSTNAYRWKTSTRENYGGTNLDVGELGPGDEDDYPALHILANVSKTWSWLKRNAYAPTQNVTVLWPEGTNASYVPWPLDQIRVGTSRQWHEDTHAHEYGHHWMYKFDVDAMLLPDYDNGYCDDGSPGHCTWCPENPNDAWDEGIPDWIADLVTSDFADYGPPAVHLRTAESLGRCDQDNAFHSAFDTEGFTHAFFNDLVDGPKNNDNDPAVTTEWQDEMDGMDGGEILVELADHGIHGTVEYINHLQSLSANSMHLWETAENNGFTGLDTTPPSGTMTVSSTSHEIGVTSANSTIHYSISQPTDDFSGVGGYKVLVSADAPGVPGTGTPDVYSEGAVAIAHTELLDPGSYWISVRARDRAGNWSTGYSSSGPYVVRAQEPLDITYGQHMGAAVAGPLVLRNDASALPAIIQWSTTLPGDSGNVYWNLVTENVGDQPALSPFTNLLLRDGVAVSGQIVEVATLMPGALHTATNAGPFSVPAGLHTMSVRYDGDHDHAEEVESNNTTAVHVVFEPPVMASGATGTRSAPPSSNAGHEDFGTGMVIRPPNLDGLRFETGLGFDAVAVWANEDVANYDCRLFEPATSLSSGFGTPVIIPEASSSRGAGLIDAVFTNANLTLPHDTWDVGVVNFYDGTSDYAFENVRSQPLPANTLHTLGLAAGKRLALRAFQVLAGATGWKELTLTAEPGDGALNVAWFPSGTLLGGLDDHGASARTDASGKAVLEFEATTLGRHLIVVWRDPVDDLSSPPGAITATLRVRVALPDLTVEETPSGWVGPVVPRRDTTGTPALVAEPSFLSGDPSPTYLNVNVSNRGSGAAGVFGARLEIDGETILATSWAGCAPEANVTHNSTSARTVRSGRHTVSVGIDEAAAVTEASETNNRFGEQFVWLPSDLPDTGLLTAPAPVGIVAGWEAVSNLRSPLRFNVDGYYLGPAAGTWYGVAVQPAPTTDVDLRLFELATDARSGFGDPLAISGWGPGALDFVLVNRAATSVRPFHVGVAGVSGMDDYQLDRLSSEFLAASPEGSFGPFGLEADQLVRLHEVSLAAGVYHIALDDESGVDLMFSLHGGEIPYGARSRPVDDGESFVRTDWAREAIDVVIAEDGSYCLAVWRRNGSDVPGPVSKATTNYSLEFGEISGTPDRVVATVPASLTSIHPSPFNAQLTIEWEIFDRGFTTLSIYDLQGRLVSTLLESSLDAGRRSIQWDGTDSRGSVVPAGVYFIRMVHDDHVEHRKAMLVK